MKQLMILCLLGTLCAAPALACGPDSNTLEKLQVRQKADFTRIDTNQDGVISREEFSRYAAWELPPGKTPDEFFRSLDKNNDQRLAFAEWAEGFPPSNFQMRGC